MKTSRALAVVLGLALTLQAFASLAQQATDSVAAPATPVAKAVAGTGYTFETTPFWQDEFDYTGRPDPAKWTHQQGGHGWGNNELQYYTDRIENAYVRDGVLTIAARKEAHKGSGYTSARLNSIGEGNFQYGRFEIRAKLPAGKGTWPALWMLPTEKTYGDWPKSGEIDIMEHVGFDPERVHITMHTEAYNHRIGTQRGASKLVEGATSGFHLYRVDWTPDWIRGYIDDQLVLEFPNEGKGPQGWPFDHRFHLLMNIAVGGDWGGKEGVDEGAFPAAMWVDYVRVYRLMQ